MNKRGNSFTFVFILLQLLAFSQNERIFSRNLLNEYARAYDLNAKGDFLNAYNMLASINREVDKEITAHNTHGFLLCDYDFQRVYWPAKKSLAETAYMLGNHAMITDVAQELNIQLASRLKSGKVHEVDRMKYLADLSKIDADRFYLTEKYNSCETALVAALQYGSKVYDNEEFIAKLFADLAQLYYKEERYTYALNYIDSTLASPYYSAKTRDKTEVEKKSNEIYNLESVRAIILARLGKYAEALKIIDEIVAYYKRQGDKCMREYGESLRKKAKILMLQYDATGDYNPEAKVCYQEYLRIARRYVDNNFINMTESEREQYWMTEQPFVTDCYRLEDKASELLYDVALFSKAVLLQMGRVFTANMTREQRANALTSIRVNWQQVQKAMPASSTAIEFVAYEKKGRNCIGALVLNKTGKPIFVPVVDKDSLMDIRLSSGYYVRDAFMSTSQSAVDALYNDRQIYEKIWNKRLVSAIGKSTRIYFAPDGIFHQMAVEYLVPQALSDKSLYRLTTTRVLTEPRRNVNTDSMLMAGFVNYNSTQTDADGISNDETAFSLMSSLHIGLPTLDDSKTEIDSIASIRKAHQRDSVLTWNEATEGKVRRLMQKYNIVLLSTHGYLPDADKIGTDIRPARSDTQLSKSCLFLSGAVRNMSDKDFDASKPDGILSAREIASINLSHVDLAILSACQTALGDITPDGVYGLQRGLKTAGVKAVIASLWSVNDASTSILMMRLCNNLEQGLSLHDAFNKAREAVRQYEQTVVLRSKARRRVLYDTPYYYDSFILIDGL